MLKHYFHIGEVEYLLVYSKGELDISLFNQNEFLGKLNQINIEHLGINNRKFNKILKKEKLMISDIRRNFLGLFSLGYFVLEKQFVHIFKCH